MFQAHPPISVGGHRRAFGIWDVVTLGLLLVTLALLAEGGRVAVAALPAEPQIDLDPANLPYYALRTTFRMVAALACSLVFTLTYATAAAKSRRAGMVLIPLLDLLQSVPILGFISVTVTFFLSLSPGHAFGAECAAIFAIFTSQAWNMAFSFYQSLRTVPAELTEVSYSLRLGPWMRFWRLEVPFAMPALVWNMMMSVSGGWFFVVASETISVGSTQLALPGVGSYIGLAVREQDLGAILWAVGTMLVVVLIYDQMLFRPLVAWADRFRFVQESELAPPGSWVLATFRRSPVVAALAAPLARLGDWTFRVSPHDRGPMPDRDRPARAGDRLWVAGVLVLLAGLGWRFVRPVAAEIGLEEILEPLGLGLVTLVRVMVLIALASLVWVPVGVWIGLSPRAARIAQPIAQFLAAFPANLLFPLAVLAILHWRLNPDVWLSPLMVLGTQWYILFNVIAGASTIPTELRDIGTSLRVRGWLWWRKIALPAVFPFYMTGALTASGGSWNAAIVSEIATWGDVTLRAHGLGAYIADATAAGDFTRILLGIAVMSGFVLILNRAVWRPLYLFAERRFRLS
ncbi:MAG: ABC transporter permease subunit [Proteobacteria bacterium]|nr:ABC transporter permease subunit [Pseudomonadota bacterium]MBS0573226.1 ABC transporter permease subunit [Pseudomonadota bacterium]